MRRCSSINLAELTRQRERPAFHVKDYEDEASFGRNGRQREPSSRIPPAIGHLGPHHTT
jgi:hypothetical protein